MLFLSLHKAQKIRGEAGLFKHNSENLKGAESMTVNNQQKQEILLNSFNVLKNDLEQNSFTISEIIGKMAKLDFEVSWEM
jgi:hypothetical protein